MKKHAMLGGIFLLGILTCNLQAQENVSIGSAPATINGSAILAHATGGTGTLANSGYYLLLPATTGSNYALIGSGGILSSTGTYDYTAAGSSGTIAFSDSILGSGTNVLTFSPDQDFSLLADTNMQIGTIEFAAGEAPGSLSNHSYFINITSGSAPFASTGSVIFSANARTNTYSVLPTSGGIAPSSGTYSYAQASTSAGFFDLADSDSGDSTEYFGFQSPTNGFYLVTQPSGGYQTGTFTVSNLVPTMFFMGQIDLSKSVEWLQFPDGTNFGYYDVMDFGFPCFYHFDMGFEWYFDANNSAHGAYLWDFTSGGFLYTDPQIFPFIYDFSLGTWLYWFPVTDSPDRYTCNPRYFWDFNTGQVITK